MVSKIHSQPKSIRQILLVIVIFSICGAGGATVSVLPQPALKVTAIENNGVSVSKVEHVDIRALPGRKITAATISVNDNLLRGTVLFVPARTAITFQSVNGVILRVEADSELYVDVAIKGGEVYELRRGKARFETTQPMRFLVLRHANGAVHARQSAFTAEADLAGEEIRIAVDSGRVNSDEYAAVFEFATNITSTFIERKAIEAGSSRVVRLDKKAKQEKRFDTVSEVDAFLASRVVEAETTRDAGRLRLALHDTASFALGRKNLREAITYFDKTRETGDDHPILLQSLAFAIGHACQAQADNACTIKYFQAAQAQAEQLYPDGLEPFVVGIRRRVELAASNCGRPTWLEEHRTKTDDLEGLLRNSTRVSIVKRGETKYPQDMRKWGLQGDGLIELTVTEDGRPKDLTVIRSPHPSFEQAIVRSALKSQFIPATRDEKPVSSRIRIPFSFRFDDNFSQKLANSDAPFRFPLRTASSVNAEFQYDEPPKFNVVSAVVYPRELQIAGVTGHAEIAVRLDEKGIVRATSVVHATHPEFAAAAIAMWQAGNYSPAKLNGKTTATAFVHKQVFGRQERDTGVNEQTITLLRLLSSSPTSISELDMLDKRPDVLYRTAPVDYRPDVSTDPSTQEVLIEFFIDPEGFVQLPRIKSAADADLGWAAATAVKRWVFEVPTVNGKPVFARRELKFEFK